MSLYFSEPETNKPKNILSRAKAGHVLDKSRRNLLSLEAGFVCPKGKYHEIKHNFVEKP